MYSKRILTLNGRVRQCKIKNNKIEKMVQLINELSENYEKILPNISTYPLVKFKAPQDYIRARTNHEEKIIEYDHSLLDKLSQKANVPLKQILKAMQIHEMTHIILKEKKWRKVQKSFPFWQKNIWEEIACNAVAKYVLKVDWDLFDIDIWYIYGKNKKIPYFE